MDQSQEMLDRAYKHPNITYINEDITKYKGEEVDAAFCLFNVVGYVGHSGLREILRNTMVRSGGYFIFDCWDYFSIFHDNEAKITTHGEFTREASIRFKATVDIKISSNKETFTESHDINPYSYSDILKICSGLYKIEEDKQTGTWTRKYKLRKI